MEKFRINNFTQKCICSNDVQFYVVIGLNQDEQIDDLGYIAQCDHCHRSTGMLSSISEAYEDSQISTGSENDENCRILKS